MSLESVKKQNRLKENNYAFIDSQNLNMAVLSQGWSLDWHRFRVYLREKYSITEAYVFLGYVDGYEALYKSLQKAGFICIFRPTLRYEDGTTKGNCDAELVLQSMIEYRNFDKAIIVTGDGDFHCLAKYFHEQGKLLCLMIPNRTKFSALLKFVVFRPYLRFVNDLQHRLTYHKKRPHEDGTS